MTNDPRLIEVIWRTRRTIAELLASDEAALTSCAGDALLLLDNALFDALLVSGSKVEG